MNLGRSKSLHLFEPKVEGPDSVFGEALETMLADSRAPESQVLDQGKSLWILS